MGTDDLDLDFGLDSTAVDLSEYILFGNAYNIYSTTYQLRWSSGEGYYYKGILRNPDFTNGFKFRVLCNANTGVGINCESFAYIKLNTGQFYMVGMNGLNVTPWTLMEGGYRQITTRPEMDGNDLNQDGATRRDDGGHSIQELHFKSDGNIDVYGTAGVSYTIPTALTYAQFKAVNPSLLLSNVMTWAATDTTRIVEIGFGFHTSSGSPVGHIGAIYLEADTGTTYSGNITIPKVHRIDVNSYLNNMGSATIKMYDKDAHTNLSSTHLPQIGKYVEIYNSVGNKLFLGELRHIRNISKNVIEYIFESAALKPAKMRCATTPVVLNYKIRCLEPDDGIHDYSQSFISITSAYIAVMAMTDYNKLIYHAVHDTVTYLHSLADGGNGTSTTPTTAGDIDNTYSDDTTLSETNNGLSGHTTDGNNFAIVTHWKIYLRDGTANISKATLDISVRFRQFSIYGATGTDFPRILIYNYSTSVYKEIYQFTKEDVGSIYDNDPDWSLFGFNTTFPISKSFDLLALLSAASLTLPNVTNTGSDNGSTTDYDMRIAIVSGDDAINDNAVFIQKIQLTLDLTTSQPPQQGQFALVNGTSERIDFTTNASLTLLPWEDGFSAGDTVKFTKTIDDFITDLGTRLGVLSSVLTISNLLTGGSTIALVGDYTYKTFIQAFQAICDQLNGMWWLDENNNKFILATQDQFAASGITLTTAYIEDSFPLWDIDATNMRNESLVIGRFNVVTQANTTSYTPSLATESEIVHAKDLLSYDEVNQLATSHNKRNEDPDRLITWQIPVSLTAALLKGSKVTVSLGDLSSGETPGWVIYGWRYTKERGRETMRFTLQERRS